MIERTSIGILGLVLVRKVVLPVVISHHTIGDVTLHG